MVKKVMAALVGILLCASVAAAEPWLVCDPTTDSVTVSEIEVTHNGTTYITPGVITLSGDKTYVMLLDLASMPNGNYTFRARWGKPDAKSTIWWSEWSDPYSIVKSGKPGNIHIKLK